MKLVYRKTIGKAILKNNLFAVTQNFECGSVGGQFFLQTELNGRDFKYELKREWHIFQFIPLSVVAPLFTTAHSEHLWRERNWKTESENMK